MKNFFLSACAVLMMACFMCSCTGQKEEQRCNTPICNYLYGAEYDDYEFESAMKLLDEQFYPDAACSEVRKGNFVGRNLDWYINCDASFVIKVNGSESRYASIGMSGGVPELNDSLASTGEFFPAYKILPIMTVDGVNEKGVYAGINVMPTGETSFDKSKWNPGKWGLGAAFTNPGAEKTYCVVTLVRYVLDNASSVAEAKKLIESVNWYEPASFPHPGESQAFHWLLADSVSNAVVEFIDNKPCFTETAEVREPSYATIMTNFTNKLMADEQLVQISGCGYERWDILHDSYTDAAESFDGMEGLMKKVWYTRAYTDELDENFKFSEFACPRFPATEMYHNPAYKDNAEFAEFIKEQKALFADKSNWHIPTSPLWYTTHSVVYDLSKREFRVITHEGLDGQEDYYAASLAESTFAKPLGIKTATK